MHLRCQRGLLRLKGDLPGDSQRRGCRLGCRLLAEGRVQTLSSWGGRHTSNPGKRKLSREPGCRCLHLRLRLLRQRSSECFAGRRSVPQSMAIGFLLTSRGRSAADPLFLPATTLRGVVGSAGIVCTGCVGASRAGGRVGRDISGGSGIEAGDPLGSAASHDISPAVAAAAVDGAVGAPASAPGSISATAPPSSLAGPVEAAGCSSTLAVVSQCSHPTSLRVACLCLRLQSRSMAS